jgi:hypothetical protein
MSANGRWDLTRRLKGQSGMYPLKSQQTKSPISDTTDTPMENKDRAMDTVCLSLYMKQAF